MNYQIKTVILSFAIGIIISFIIIPILRRLKVGQIEREDGPQSHLKKQGTPTMGGIVMMISMIVLMVTLYIEYRVTEATMIHSFLPLCFTALGFGMVGAIDDFKKLVLKNTEGLKPAYKMFGLLIIAVTFVILLCQTIGTQTYLPIVKTYIILPAWIYIPFAIFVMLGTTNAVNLTDGIDGLATSITTIIIACLTVIGIMFNVKEVVLLGSVVCGSNLAFLLFNLHPAKVFMGDTGSLFLGGVIVVMALYLKIPLLLVVIAFIPVLETLSVILQVAYYKKTGKRIFKMAPLHHHFELSGWNENKVVTIFSIFTLILCVIGFMMI